MKKIIFMLLSVLIIFVFVGVITSYSYEKYTYDIDLKGDNRLKIVHFSDVHIRSIKEPHLKKLVAMINEEAPDLVIFTGDLYEKKPPKTALIEHTIKMLQAIKCPNKIAVSGNHDIYKMDQIYQETMNSADFTYLKDEYLAPLTFNKGTLNIYGSHTIYDNKTFKPKVITPSNYEELIIIAHEPKAFDYFAHLDNVAVQISGHSHGGQVRLPFVGSPFFLFSRQKYGNQRHYRVNNRDLYINFGFGNKSPNIRLYLARSINIYNIT